MILAWTENGWADYLYWQQNDRSMLEKVNTLLKDARRAPFAGLGKPEPLKGNLAGWWSRRIAGDHRLIYKVEGQDAGQRLTVASCRYHYEKGR